MSKNEYFPSLEGWEATRDTLHWYAQGVGVAPRAHAISKPHWWHISLKVQPDGLFTDNMALPDGGAFYLKLDLHDHVVRLVTNRDARKEFDMRAGMTATEFGESILEAVAGLGLEAEYARGKFENDDPREYDPDFVKKYLTALVNADILFKRHRAGLEGDVGPVQLWPHGFDLAFEWFGDRQVSYEEDGEMKSSPSQLNLGFSPGEPSHPEPYFYSNPWPFEKDELLDVELPGDARWFTESWEGSILPYKSLVENPQPDGTLLSYARAVYEAAYPTLREQNGQDEDLPVRP